MESKPPIMTLLENRLGFLLNYFDVFVLLSLVSVMIFPLEEGVVFWLWGIIYAMFLFGLLTGRYSLGAYRIQLYSLIVFLPLVFVLVRIITGGGDTPLNEQMRLLIPWLIGGGVYVISTITTRISRIDLYMWIVYTTTIFSTLVEFRYQGVVTWAIVSISILASVWMFYRYRMFVIRLAFLALLVCLFYIGTIGTETINWPILITLLVIFIVQRSGLVLVPLSMTVGAVFVKSPSSTILMPIESAIRKSIVWVQQVSLADSFPILIGAGVDSRFLADGSLYDSVLSAGGVVLLFLLMILVISWFQRSYRQYVKSTLAPLKSTYLLGMSLVVFLVSALFGTAIVQSPYVLLVAIYMIGISVQQVESDPTRIVSG